MVIAERKLLLVR